jgi:hypothetical protein
VVNVKVLELLNYPGLVRVRQATDALLIGWRNNLAALRQASPYGLPMTPTRVARR